MPEREMPAITILDYVKSVVGKKDTYDASDHAEAGVLMLGGCAHCYATIGSYNAYPSTLGVWLCADCIGDRGFATVEEFAGWSATYEEDDDFSDPYEEYGFDHECEL